MNREQQMDAFLKNFAKIYIQNPSFPITDNTLYGNLSIYGLSSDEINNRNISNYFNSWIQRYQNNNNLNVFYTERQPGFLQFTSYENPGSDHVKLYLSYPKDKIYECANKIFDFISYNNISCHSKISQNLRSDSVVLRITNFEDAAKVINYVNSDSELYHYSKQTNPFSPKHGVIAYAYDNLISFNSTLSLLMEKYFIMCRQNNMLTNVSLEHFKIFVSTYYTKTFQTKENINELIKEKEFTRLQPRFETIGHAITNFDDVIRLILYSLDPNMNIEIFRQFHEQVTNLEYKNNKANEYNDYINYLNLQQNQNNSRQTINLNNLNQTNNQYTVFENACIATFNKYGEMQLNLAISKSFKGNYNCFTNTENGYRFTLQHMNLPKEKIMEFCDILISTYPEAKEFVSAIQNAKLTYFESEQINNVK